MTVRRLIAVMVWAAAWPALAAEPAPHGKTQPAAAAVSPLAAQPLDRFSATRDRPLFSPTRRPPAPPPVAAAVAAPTAAPPAPPPNVVLLGVVMDGDDAHAVVRTGPKILRVRIGDEIGGWKVGQIEARKLVLLLKGRTATFAMFTGKDVKRFPNTAAAAALPNARRTAGPIVPSSRRGRPR
jgi:hypothetical protein